MSKIVDKNTLKAFRQKNDERYLLDGEYSPETSVGHADTANNLSSNIYQSENTAFIRQSSGGNVDIITGLKSAKLTKLKGSSLYFNQLFQNGNFANGVEPWYPREEYPAKTVLSASDGVLSQTWLENQTDTHYFQFGLQQDVPTTVGHEYLFFGSVKSPITANYRIECGGGRENEQFQTIANEWTNFAIIIPVKAEKSRIIIFPDQLGLNQGDVVQYRNLNFVDLTVMFGEGNEPTVDEFKALFPLAYYNFNTGELISARSSKITSYSANLYTENAFPVISGEDYAIAGVTACNIVEKNSAGDIINSTAYSALSTVYALDNITHIGYVDSNIKGVRLNGNTAYVILTDVTAISGETVYFGLAWSKPYTDYKEHFSIEYALNNVVLRGVGEYFDTYEPNGVITRKIGVLTAQTGAIGDTITLTGAISDSPIMSSAGADIGTVSGKTLTLTKAISDATILYVLETATTEQGTPYTEEQYVNDYGIQIFDTAFPQPCEFLYQINLKDYLQRLYGVSDGNPYNIAIKNQVLALTGQITVQTTDWNNNVATATFATLGANDYIQFSPATETDKTNYMNADIFATVSGTTVTFTATTTPSADITLTYVIIRGIN